MQQANAEGRKTRWCLNESVNLLSWMTITPNTSHSMLSLARSIAILRRCSKRVVSYVRAVVAAISRWANSSHPRQSHLLFGGVTLQWTVEHPEHLTLSEAVLMLREIVRYARINPATAAKAPIATQDKMMATSRNQSCKFRAQRVRRSLAEMLGRTPRGLHHRTFHLRPQIRNSLRSDAALPGQTMEGWKQILTSSAAWPEHLSLTCSTCHEARLCRQSNRGMRPKPDEDLAA